MDECGLSKVDVILAIEGGILTTLAVATGWNASVIKVIGQMCSNVFEKRLGFSFTAMFWLKTTFYYC